MNEVPSPPALDYIRAGRLMTTTSGLQAHIEEFL